MRRDATAPRSPPMSGNNNKGSRIVVSTFMSPDDIRAAFSSAMSSMCREEVPAYATLIDLVSKVDENLLARRSRLREQPPSDATLERVGEEPHVSILLGIASELNDTRRLFAVMGMYPVGYYDLSEAGVPIHSTSFRPVGTTALLRKPFQVFTSLLRLDLISDLPLRSEASRILARRKIFTEETLALVAKAELHGGLTRNDAVRFVASVVATFRWQYSSGVPGEFERLRHDHHEVADVVSLKAPYINHLTASTLDIDTVQARIPLIGITPTPVIAGPPPRKCPIFLRQFSFKSVAGVSFEKANGHQGSHTARFGEIVQRGIALTAKGRKLYDRLLTDTRRVTVPAADGSNAKDYQAALADAFTQFPDDWKEIRERKLGYFFYSRLDNKPFSPYHDLEDLITMGRVRADPIIYEGFLPSSGAGAFHWNGHDNQNEQFGARPDQAGFERDLGQTVLNEFARYQAIESASIHACLSRPSLRRIA